MKANNCRYEPLTTMISNGNPMTWMIHKKSSSALYIKNVYGKNMKVVGDSSIMDAFNLSCLLTELKYLSTPNAIDYPSQYINWLKREITRIWEADTDGNQLVLDFLNSRTMPVGQFMEENVPTAKCIRAAVVDKMCGTLLKFPEYKFLKEYKNWILDGAEKFNSLENVLLETFPNRTKIGRWYV